LFGDIGQLDPGWSGTNFRNLRKKRGRQPRHLDRKFGGAYCFKRQQHEKNSVVRTMVKAARRKRKVRKRFGADLGDDIGEKAAKYISSAMKGWEIGRVGWDQDDEKQS